MRTLMLFLLLGLQVTAQEISVKKGVVMDSLKVNDTLAESYALFLPSGFQEQRAWPVIFVFDPQGRGKSAAQLFKPAAEQQDYVVVASNDISANKPLQENLMTAARLMSQVTAMLPVDFNQISVAGFGEGADVATSVPLVFDNLHGVIAIGRHFFNYEALNGRKKEFTFVGLVGDRQFTSYGIKSAAQALDFLKFPNEVHIYEGGEKWPHPDLISAAMASLTISAMKKGLRPQDPGLINNFYNQDLARVNRMLSNQRYVQGYDLLEVLEEKYLGLRDVSEVKERKKQLARSRNFREQEKEIREITAKEEELLKDYVFYLAQDIATANFENLGWWNYQRLQLDALSESEKETEVNMGYRLQGFIKELLRVKKRELQESETTLEQSLLINMVQTIFDQTNFEAYKNILSLSALDGDYNTALFYLEEMLKNGYDNEEELYNIEGTLGLRMTPQFNWLVKKYLGSSRYYKDFELEIN